LPGMAGVSPATPAKFMMRFSRLADTAVQDLLAVWMAQPQAAVKQLFANFGVNLTRLPGMAGVSPATQAKFMMRYSRNVDTVL